MLSSTLSDEYCVIVYQTTEKAIVRKEKHLEEEEADEDEEVIYKIEVPANRCHFDDIFVLFASDEIRISEMWL